MTLDDIVRQVNRDTRERFSNADITDWVNRALDDLTPVAKKEESTTYTADSSNSYPLPSDLHQIYSVSVDSVGYTFTTWSGDLSLDYPPDTGTVTLKYFRRLNKMKYPSDIPEIEEEFQDLLILYAIGQLQFRESDDRPDALNKYYQRKQEYQTFINRKYAVPAQINDVYGVL